MRPRGVGILDPIATGLLWTAALAVEIVQVTRRDQETNRKEI
jgi:hypothetical protein